LYWVGSKSSVNPAYTFSTGSTMQSMLVFHGSMKSMHRKPNVETHRD
jgi:hypothetical protein